MASRLLQPGDSLGKYEIVQELAVGGMASIYLARVTGTAGFEKNVVLKSILPSLANDRGFVSMFLDEARLAATLRHSNIADVFDVGNEGNHYYFAMEYVHGQNARAVRLEAKQKGVTIPIEVALAIVLGTAAALAYAHDVEGPNGPLGLVHRDVSPSNILVSYEGAVKLVDFGIARASLRSGAKTRTGMRKGKTPYMSPEQCKGTPMDRRSDLFSLGTVLYELTAPQRPFIGNSDFEVMEAIVHGKPPLPSRLVPTYPAELERIVLRMLAPDPAARYPTAHGVLEDLERFAKENGILTSAHVVARFMRELFLATPASERDTYTDFGNAAAMTKEYPHGRPPSGLVRTLQHADEEPTSAFKRGEVLWAPELKVKIRTPRADSQHGDEPSITSPFAERTRQDVVVPFDPIDARSEEILAHLDDNAPADETADARAYRRIDTLIHQAMAWMGIGQSDKAVAAVELALDEDISSAEVQTLLQSHVDTIVNVYEALLEDPYRTPRLTRTVTELAGVPMESDARALLPLIDGSSTIHDILERSGMQRLEVYHHLCQLQLRGIMQ